MVFDATINLGQIITLVGMVAAGSLAFGAVRADVWNIKSDVQRLNDRLDEAAAELRKQTEILIQLGRQDERLNMLTRRVDALTLGVRS